MICPVGADNLPRHGYNVRRSKSNYLSNCLIGYLRSIDSRSTWELPWKMPERET
jgi:hypothetical protein